METKPNLGLGRIAGVRGGLLPSLAQFPCQHTHLVCRTTQTSYPEVSLECQILVQRSYVIQLCAMNLQQRGTGSPSPGTPHSNPCILRALHLSFTAHTSVLIGNVQLTGSRTPAPSRSVEMDCGPSGNNYLLPSGL